MNSQSNSQPTISTTLDGRALSARMRQSMRSEVAELSLRHGRAPGLAVILVGDDPASQIYVRNKTSGCHDLGINSISHPLPADTSQQHLLGLIGELNQDPKVDGILVQLPLPTQISADAIIGAIDPGKDVDGFHPYNIGCLMARTPALRPCTPYGCMKLIEETGVDLHGMEAVIVGASNIVGRPMAMELLLAGATVTITHRFTNDLAAHIADADIVVAAVGKPGVVDGRWIKRGAIVIDVGITRLPNGSLAGDVEFSSASQRAGWITPVPGGVGPMTITMLLANTITAFRNHVG
ncbi:MAG: bifunctional methylenetetrahydrofolate dehydrogenase/methenyltetrahydrofolate cyclohydrolase FolD, partial [Mariprofundales bacterium]|nr:bifunctional methylenetetrahydrofolate dehydrogenase/methenyltetrahydrofolate cyclohydrolase FolD [Mariprofundales bacterium]